MLTTTMEERLNKQIELEGYASFLYLSMASWCSTQGVEGCSQFMHRQSEEERAHMLRIFNYINEIDGHAKTPAIPQPPLEFESVQEMFKQVYAHEKKVTNAIKEIVSLCYKEDDYTTLNFMQWYIEEQREEEDLMRGILDKIKLIGDAPQSLYYIDKEIELINEAEIKMAAAEGGQ